MSNGEWMAAFALFAEREMLLSGEKADDTFQENSDQSRMNLWLFPDVPAATTAKNGLCYSSMM